MSIVKKRMKASMSLVLAFLMLLSSFVFLKAPISNARASLVLDSDNWRGWYECFINGAVDGSVNGEYLAENGFSPLSVEEGRIVSSLRQANAGWDDFVAVTSNCPVLPSAYSMKINIQTGMSLPSMDIPYISDELGLGVFSVGILTDNNIRENCFDDWMEGVRYGLAGSEGYVINFTADPLENICYGYYSIYKAENGMISDVLAERVPLHDGIVNAHGLAPITIKLVKCGDDRYDIVLSDTNISQTLANGVYIEDTTPLYYGAGAFSSAINNGTIAPTSSAFEIVSVSDCSGERLPSELRDYNHDYRIEDNGSYRSERCVTCGTVIRKSIDLTYDGNGGIEAPYSENITAECDADGKLYCRVSPVVPENYGYLFNGWVASSNDADVDGRTYQPGEELYSGAHVRFLALWVTDPAFSPYHIDFDANGGEIVSGHSNSYIIHFDESYASVLGDMPIAEREGYDFEGWYNEKYDYFLDISDTYRVWEDMLFVAVWTKKASYTLTFDTDGGIMPDGYALTYNFESGERFEDVIGELPIPVREEYVFYGWENIETGEMWINIWGTQPYIYDTDITLRAIWICDSGYTLSFNANGYLYGETRGEEISIPLYDALLPNGREWDEYRIYNEQSLAEATGSEFFEGVHDRFTFVGWIASYSDEYGEAQSVVVNSDNWESFRFKGISDIVLTAYYKCEHSKFCNEDFEWDKYSDPNKWIAICPGCNLDGAYGYTVNFLARNNYMGEISLSDGVSVNELFEYEHCEYDPVDNAIVDFLDIDERVPEAMIHIKFDPRVLAARNNDEGWLGWAFEDDPDDYSKEITYIFDQNNPFIAKHLTLRAVYAEGYHEVIFDGSTGINGALGYDGVIVDFDRALGVAAVCAEDSFADVLDYIPQAKHVGSYPVDIMNPVPASNGSFYSYIDPEPALYCSIGWSDIDNFMGANASEKAYNMYNAWSNGEVLNYSSYEDNTSITKDTVLLPWYFSSPVNENGIWPDDGVAQGYLNTVYANNKGAEYEYNNAYFDPDEMNGGTMYYMYQKTNNGYSCTPVFGFDAADYDRNDVFIYEPDSDYQFVCDFNIYAYEGMFDHYSTVIAKEPKRCTYYVGEGGAVLLPTVAADPCGRPYTEPEAVTDENGNTYYIGLDNDFRLTRNSKGERICNLYSVYACEEAYSEYYGYIRLGYPSLSHDSITGNELYMPVSEKGDYIALWEYADIGECYGAGLALSYPDGNDTVFMNPLMNGSPMQSCCYTQWDFSVGFDANYPDGAFGEDQRVYGFFDSYKPTLGMNNKLFECEGYALEAWQLYDVSGNSVICDHGPFITGEELVIYTSDKYPESDIYNEMTDVERSRYEVSPYNAYVYAITPGCVFRAVWKELPKSELGVSNYTVSLTQSQYLSYIRYAPGSYDSSSEIKWAQGCVTLNASKIAEYSKEGICYIDMPEGGEYSVWIKYTDGREEILHADLTKMDQEIELYGATVTIKNLYGVRDIYIGRGVHNTYSDVKANGVVQVTSNKIGSAHDYSYILPGSGDYTLCVRYNDTQRPYRFITFTVIVTEPIFTENGLQLLVDNLDDVKVIRTAYGEYETAGDIKRAEGARAFSAKTIAKTEGAYTIQYREEGKVTVAVVYNDGYTAVYKYNVTKKTPIMRQSGNRVHFSMLDDLTLIRYAKGVYESSAEIKRAQGSVVIKPESITNNRILFTLEAGVYTFCVQYNDESYNYYTVTVE